MITFLRHFFVDTWLGRLIILFCFIIFIGIGGVVSYGNWSHGNNTDILKIDGHAVDATSFERSLLQQIYGLHQQGMSMDNLSSAMMQEQLVQMVLAQLLRTQEDQAAAHRNGIIITDDAIRNVVFDAPMFKNNKGIFDPHKMDEMLKNNGLDHLFLIQQVSQFLADKAVFIGLEGSATFPLSTADYISHYLTQSYKVDYLELPFDDGTVGEIDSVKLKRFFLNHKEAFKSPEYRHIKLVALTPQAVMETIPISDKFVKSVYDENAETEYKLPELRDIYVFKTSSEEAAKDIAESYNTHLSWDKMQQEIQNRFPDAIPVALEKARQADIPDSALAKVIFSAHAGDVSHPVKTETGWNVFYVSKVYPPHVIPFHEAKEKIIDNARREQLPHIYNEHMKAFQEAVAGSVDLQHIPDGIGLIPAMGMLDGQGHTEDDTIAPIPGDMVMRDAILKQAFSQSTKILPHVIDVPGHGAFALEVDKILPPSDRNFDQAKEYVKKAWIAEEKKHKQEELASTILQSARKFSSVKDAIKEYSSYTSRWHFHDNLITTQFDKLHNVPDDIKNNIFRIKKGEIKLMEAGGSFWIIHMIDTLPASYEEQQKVMQDIKQKYTHELRDDLANNLSKFYAKEAPPQNVNLPLIFQSASFVMQKVGIVSKLPSLSQEK